MKRDHSQSTVLVDLDGSLLERRGTFWVRKEDGGLGKAVKGEGKKRMRAPDRCPPMSQHSGEKIFSESDTEVELWSEEHVKGSKHSTIENLKLGVPEMNEKILSCMA